MSEVRLNQQDTPPPKQSNRTIFYILLILLLVGINVYLYVKYNQTNKNSQNLTEQVSNDSIRIADLDLKYQETLVNIESYKGQNAMLDSIIAVKEKELVGYKADLDAMKKKMRVSEADYKKQMSGLQALVTDLTAQIKDISDKNQILITRNDSLGQSLASEINTNAQLQSTNQVLSQKVSVASLLKPKSLLITGIRGKSSGKEVETNNAEKAEKIKVCFDIPANPTSEAGEKIFMVRIISPEGTTLAVQNSGSGTFQVAETAEQRQYTTSTAVPYDQKAKNVCTYWQQSSPFGKGNYTTEIYQEGYLLASKSFELK
jgi:predicted RNase H-like nuclease (RuvC/YqgF family)